MCAPGCPALSWAQGQFSPCDDLAHDLADDLTLADNVPGFLQPEESERRLPVAVGLPPAGARLSGGGTGRALERSHSSLGARVSGLVVLSFPECPWLEPHSVETPQTGFAPFVVCVVSPERSMAGSPSLKP